MEDCWHLVGGILSHNLKIRAHATRRYWSCQSVCQCIPLSRKHHVPECQVLPTKHNSSVSGCHFTKPGRLGEITSICGKTNGRQERTAWDMTSNPGSIVFRRPSNPLQPSCCHLRPSPCFYLLSPWTSIQPPTHPHTQTASRCYCASLSDLSDSQNCNAIQLWPARVSSLEF